MTTKGIPIVPGGDLYGPGGGDFYRGGIKTAARYLCQTMRSSGVVVDDLDLSRGLVRTDLDGWGWERASQEVHAK